MRSANARTLETRISLSCLTRAGLGLRPAVFFCILPLPVWITFIEPKLLFDESVGLYGSAILIMYEEARGVLRTKSRKLLEGDGAVGYPPRPRCNAWEAGGGGDTVQEHPLAREV